MINANELRYGNWVFLGEDPQEIVGIHNDRVKFGWQSAWSTKAFDLSPAIINPETLEAAGFRRYDNDWYEITYGNKKKLSIECDTGRICFGKGDYFLDIGIKYIHQLQNFYFFTTGEELQINL